MPLSGQGKTIIVDKTIRLQAGGSDADISELFSLCTELPLLGEMVRLYQGPHSGIGAMGPS